LFLDLPEFGKYGIYVAVWIDLIDFVHGSISISSSGVVSKAGVWPSERMVSSSLIFLSGPTRWAKFQLTR
jgi:hypothetical protein